MAGRHGNDSNKAAGTKVKVSAENDKTKEKGHVASLKEEFRNGIRRTEPKNFMRASVSQEEWNKLLEAVVTGISTSTIPCPVSLQDVPSVENLSQLAKDTSTILTCATPNHALLVPQNAID
ncbi:hypothetical protein BDW72DRAFT_209081 [Aspergillus terricola var. indicus]